MDSNYGRNFSQMRQSEESGPKAPFETKVYRSSIKEDEALARLDAVIAALAIRNSRPG